MSTTTFENVSVDPKANVYFDGRVVSHTLHLPDGSRKTIGLIYPGEYHIGTAAPELMEISAGTCEVTIDGTDVKRSVEAGSSFDVPGKSGFTISVPEQVICQYICSFLPGE
ncbi:pyrimidine/purine nucleoside phosphorylase [Luteolibacter pohnpeiensis]|uniref:Pyrimidine/purine nucleoside phosphorylase n=1 Tax=Luteolibacter pohnpeiensis TaxID=454153 RepID=A0A934S7D2_9BACT|nr:pyrimidine/purine nucleoside phosphorylase [Luteolibacter pohnpeiensis]MBK1882151.1 pyrimidine/purine nucleoside phosphorylase [Luteolibacter pohnpeiensis]